jgi:selenocysteine-specific elongation factor
MRVIGTAGHVDHGKSTLIAALTGTHPDRLKEEQEREMTIDLGFGWLKLPGGEEVGIVDVPGHRDFIENMLAGVGGIDAALLVIAADEGVMPQTREHLAILDLLQIKTGLVVLTKTDLVDTEWLDLVELDVRAALQGTTLQEAQAVRVSAKTGSGLDGLLAALERILAGAPERIDFGRPRLPVDRVFSMPGFGTVVTGTLSDGSLHSGDEIVVLPSGKTGRIRGLQTHRRKEDLARPGSRTAVNLGSLAVEDIRRGEVLATPGHYTPTRRIDVHFRLLPDAAGPLRHNTEVKFFLGAAETIGAARLLGAEELSPGAEGWLQLELRDPVVAVRGDRYILRRPSPGETIGGGVVVDPLPAVRHKRFDRAVLDSLQDLLAGSPADVLLQAALATGPAPLKEIFQRSRLEASTAQAALEELLEAGVLIPLEDGAPAPQADTLVAPAPHWQGIVEKVVTTLAAYHSAFPLRRGIPREELRSRTRLPARTFNAALRRLAADGLLVEAGAAVAEPGHTIRFDDGQQAVVRDLMRRFAQSPYSPPTARDVQMEVGEEILNALIETGELVAVSPEVVFRRDDYRAMVEKVRAFLGEHGQISVAEARDLFDSSRKYMLGLLEHLDATGVTVRDGDARRLK